jgi:hypothetical protein
MVKVYMNFGMARLDDLGSVSSVSEKDTFNCGGTPLLEFLFCYCVDVSVLVWDKELIPNLNDSFDLLGQGHRVERVFGDAQFGDGPHLDQFILSAGDKQVVGQQESTVGVWDDM